MLKKWLEMGDKISFDNEDMLKILFCVLCSQYFKDYKIKYFGGLRSIKMSCLLILPSRSGKGQATGLFRKTSKKLGLDVVTATKITDAGLVGSLDQELLKENSKNKVKFGDPKYRDPVIYGDLYDKNVIIFNEAKTMLKGSQFSEDILEILQEATDDEGLIRKKLSASVDISFKSSSSFIATTYYLKELNTVLLEQGIMQRILVLVKQKDFEDRKKLNNMIIDNIQNATDIKDDINKFCEEMKTIREKKTDKVYTIESTAIKAIKQCISSYEEIINQNYRGKEFELLLPFTTSAIELLIKISCILSIVDKKHKKATIKNTHVLMANKILVLCMKSIYNRMTAKVSSNLDENNVHKFIITTLKKTPGMPKTKLYEQIMDKYAANRNKVCDITQKMVKQKMLRIEKKKVGTSNRPLECLYVNKIV